MNSLPRLFFSAIGVFLSSTTILGCFSSSPVTLNAREVLRLSTNYRMNMQLKLGPEDFESEYDDHTSEKLLSRYSSVTSLSSEAPYDPQSDDLDKLSICLSEASSESNEGKRPSLFSELLQAHLALWTLIGSIFYSYAWKQHRKKFIFSIFVMVPPLILACITISSLLTAIVILSRIFSTPLGFNDILKFGGAAESYEESKNNQHRRTLSINSYQSSISGHSVVTDDYELPKPMCRKHSASNGSLNQISHYGSTSPNFIFNGDSIKSPTSHRFNYIFTHSSGGGESEVH